LLLSFKKAGNNSQSSELFRRFDAASDWLKVAAANAYDNASNFAELGAVELQGRIRSGPGTGFSGSEIELERAQC
jgi:hypothetical protein